MHLSSVGLAPSGSVLLFPGISVAISMSPLIASYFFRIYIDAEVVFIEVVHCVETSVSECVHLLGAIQVLRNAFFLEI